MRCIRWITYLLGGFEAGCAVGEFADGHWVWGIAVAAATMAIFAVGSLYA